MEHGSPTRVSWPDEQDLAAEFERLERQLSAWMNAVHEAHRVLQGAGPGVVLERNMEAVVDAGEEPVALRPGPEDFEDDESGDDEQRASVEAGLTGAPDSADATRSPDDGASAEPTPTPREKAETELLRSLDEDAVRWIRVRQRISGKSVEELVAEYRSNKRTKKA